MTPNFLLFHTENVNEAQDSVCHLILIPVVEGRPREAMEFFFNPETDFNYVVSGITEKQVLSFASFSDLWPSVQKLFDQYDMAVCTAEGYSAHSIFKTLSRLRISFNPIHYCNAKAICRRTLNEVSYSFDYLSYKFYKDYIYPINPVAIANRWCDFVIKGLSDVEYDNLQDFLYNAGISTGTISPKEFIPSLCKRNIIRNNFDASMVSVDAQPDNPFYGMNVVFTGKMSSLKRNDARAAVVRVGGIAPENLTQETDYLVVGIQDLRIVGEKGLSGKMKTAAKYKEKGIPIEIIDEADFINMIGSKNLPQIDNPKKSIFETIDNNGYLNIKINF